MDKPTQKQIDEAIEDLNMRGVLNYARSIVLDHHKTILAALEAYKASQDNTEALKALDIISGWAQQRVDQEPRGKTVPCIKSLTETIRKTLKGE